MNWNYWLPWRDYPQDDTEDSSYEDEVIERCDHDFEQTAELLPNLAFGEATIEEGHIVVPQYEKVEEFCVKCGEPGLDGEANPYADDYVGYFSGTWTRVGRRLAFKPTFEIDPDLSVSDAMMEPVEQPADYVVDEDGTVEKVEDEEGAGRVIVNQSDEAAFGVTD
jgi:hypothetical protein